MFIFIRSRVMAFMLATSRFHAALDFLARCARPVEQARANAAFHRGGAYPVLTALAPYALPGGGFTGLEPDFQVPQPSVLATLHALDDLTAVGAPSRHPLVTRACTWLVNAWDAKRQSWPLVPPHDHTAPHAPWWNTAGDYAAAWNDFADNPRPHVLAHLWRHRDTVPADLLASSLAAVEARLKELAPDAVEPHGLLCYLRLARTPDLPTALHARLLPWLEAAVAAKVERDPARWGQYVLRPVDVVATPADPWAHVLASELPVALDNLIAQQAADGAWHPRWNWGEAFPGAWRASARAWAGILTLQALLLLRAFGRLPTAADDHR